ncbi:transglycosylase SLT domain-containing protein [Bosea sp. (in: a-proteobacteria)]|uniref:transglycosylase SLT domain-containing protein n=1 Tax=Bosea sp. (in: a-proteobacteria) TaxID=1871050 RepID=UPI0025C5A0B3|nr:transglycosylase SLT domain-containing protein [Bosea sp. (in: a-proteobacteria)]
MSQRFKQFQAAFREDACLEAMMQASRGGINIACPACGRVSAFVPRLKLRAYACGHCNFLVSPCAGTPLESRRTSLQLWFFAIRLLAEQGPKAAATLEREAGISSEQARRMVGELEAAAKDGAGWFAAAHKAVAGGAGLVPAPGIAGAARSALPRKASQGAAISADGAGRTRLLALAGAGSVVVAVMAGVAVATLTPVPAPAPDPDFAPAETVDAPSLQAPMRPSLILSSVEGDLEAARQATQFALSNDPSLAALTEQSADEASGASPQVPALPLPVLPPSNILLVPPKLPARPGAVPAPAAVPRQQLPRAPITIGGDPDQILTFGPIRIRRHLVDIIVRAGRVVGADPTLLMAVADKESSFSTTVQAKTSSATGLYQFIEQTWLGVVFEFGRKHGMMAEAALVTRNGRQFVVADANERQRILDLRREPYLSALLAAEMLKRDTLRLEKAMGRHLTGGEIYLIHFLGPDAAQTFIETMEETPGASAAELLPRPAQANRPIFYAEAGGETKTLSVSEVHKKFNEMIKVRLDRYKVVRGGAAPPAPARSPSR